MDKKILYYRGESKDYGNTKCIPLIFRKKWFSPIAEKKYYEQLINEFSSNAIFEKIKKDTEKKEYYFLKQLGALQHYGYATRLLDVSRNENVAKYFASCANFNDDGFIYLFDPDHTKEIKTPSAKSIVNKIKCINNADIYVNDSVIKGLNIAKRHTIVNNYVVDYKITLKDVIGDTSDNLRLEIQKGAFLLFGQVLDEKDCLTEDYNLPIIEEVITVKASDKMENLIELAFPDIDDDEICNVIVYPDSKESMDTVAEYWELLLTKNNSPGKLPQMLKLWCERLFEGYGLDESLQEIITDNIELDIEEILENEILFCFIFIEFIRYANEVKCERLIKDTYKLIMDRYRNRYSE